MSLKEKLLKNSTIKETSILTDSEYFNGSGIVVPTVVPMINVALSGRLNGGLTAGVNMIAGASRSFKTAFALLLAGAYLKKFPDGIVLFYDSEFGTNESYFKNFNVDKDKIVHTPMTSVEQLRHDISVQLEAIKRGEHLLIIMDSLGNLASKKEVEDALEGKSAADMTRAKSIKSLFRIITPHLVMKDIPLVVVNHTYKEMGLFPRDIVSGGCLVEDTKLIMYDNSIKNIQDINVGELVATRFGPKLVTDTWNPETLVDGTPDCYEIEFEDGHIIKVSDKHPFLVNGKWMFAENLTIDDDVYHV